MRRLYDLGQARIFPQRPVVAGSFTTIHYAYTAGHPIDDTGYIKIAFRSVSDFGVPQLDDPAAPNYCTVSTTGDCHIEMRWDPKGHTRPWSKALYLKIGRGFLGRGEEIRLIFGDTIGGSPGWQMQTFCVDSFEFKTLVDPIATYQFKELPVSPSLRIVPGKAIQAHCIAPSQVLVNNEFGYFLKLEDRWGNPTDLPQRLIHPGFVAAAVQTITAVDEQSQLSAQSNPIDVLEQDVALHPYWADFHGQSAETIGSNSIEDYFRFARDYGLLDIIGHQGNDFQITDAFWEKIKQISQEFYVPGSLLTFPGFEWSGNTPLGGDRNVYFAAEGGQITRSSAELLPGMQSQYPDSPTAMELFENLSKQTEALPFAFAHVGGRYADLSMHDPAIELAVEVHSAWGTFEWLVQEAMQRGYRVGICANSDGHKCRPGASYPGASYFGSLGGLTCVLASELDRESVYQALTERHFYATTGNRCLLDVKLVTGDNRSAMMGDLIPAGDGVPHLHVRVVGTGPVESVQVWNGIELLETHRPYGQKDLGRRVKVVWSGAAVRGRGRMVSWDGGLQIKGNTMVDARPINFWNANRPLEQIGNQGLAWKSVTTGGLAGVIVTLEHAAAGTLEVNTVQRQAICEIASIGLEPMVWTCAEGLEKEIRIYRLGRRPQSNEFAIALPLTRLRQGDNPIYIRMAQEDGHMAWSSPIFLVSDQHV